MIVVIADDITGAAEIAGVCLRYGLKTRFEINSVSSFSDVPDVLVIATNTRSLSLKKSVVQIRKIARTLKKYKQITLFKKIDSALRGHILEESAALADAFGINKIGIFPANPKAGRIIKNSVYYINNVPINETSFAHDPDFPATKSKVFEILPIKNFSDKYDISVPDTENAIMLKKQLKNFNSSNSLIAGSAFTFEMFLKNNCSLVPVYNDTCDSDSKNLSTKRVMICGSTHENSKKFIKRQKTFQKIGIDILKLRLTENKEMFDWWLNERVLPHFEISDSLLFFINAETQKSHAKEIEKLFSKITTYLIDKQLVNELFIEGGATAYSCLTAAGITSLEPINEFSAGVVRMKVSNCENLHITLKPGSYRWAKKIKY
jgi:Uncharacterized protein conserved in bacteria